VTMKFVEVFMMETCVVDVPRASAVVNRDHIWGQVSQSLRSYRTRQDTYDAVENKVEDEEELFQGLA
jgi:hypothetical protein